MRSIISTRLEQGRVRFGVWMNAKGLMGAFLIQGPCGAKLKIVSSGNDPGNNQYSQGWEHVSVSLDSRIPNWIEMCFVKDLFWNEEECVVQYHPPKSKYINNHPYCLHLWRHQTEVFPFPPSILVGLKE